jgi:hypothetical protein
MPLAQTPLQTFRLTLEPTRPEHADGTEQPGVAWNEHASHADGPGEAAGVPLVASTDAFVSVSALSRRITQLEGGLGRRRSQRTMRQVRLMEAGGLPLRAA